MDECNPLMWGHVRVAELLIAAGADINTLRADGDTPLDTALRFRNQDIARTLREAGALEGRQCRLAEHARR
jgi:ankyrin repeat protein